MTNEQLKQLEAMGFHVEETGGGCQWLRKQLNENISLVITDGEAGLPDLTAQLYVIVGEHSDYLATSGEMSTVQLIDLLWKGGVGL
jgi:hypothetical protein